MDWKGVCLVSILSVAGALNAAAPAGDPKALSRPAMPPGVQVWNADALATVDGEKGAVPTGGPLRPLRLVAPRNGTSSGQVVISSDGKLGPVAAKLTPLALANGEKVLPTAVRIRYATRKTPQMKEAAGYCDALLDAALGDTNIQPVWVTVKVPADAKPGLYKGTLSVSGGGVAKDVPVQLTVCAWKLPDPQDYATWLSLFNSFETPAYQYGVPLWSERHLQLLAKSLELLGQTGNDVLHIPAITHTFSSAEQSIVVFARKGGDLVPDFTFLDKYLDLYQKYVGAPKILSLDLWHHHLAQADKQHFVPLQVIVTNGARLEKAPCPMYGPPATEALWRQVVDGVRERMKKRGWNEKALMLGEGSDGRPEKETVNFFKKVAPGAKWTLFSHGRGDPAPKNGYLAIDGMEVGYAENPGPKGGRKYKEMIQGSIVWDGEHFLNAESGRHNWVSQYADLPQFRCVVDNVTSQQVTGLCRVGLDYWSVPVSGGQHGLTWQFSGWFNLWRNNANALLAPGPDGAVSTVRFEAFVEGIQECEARLVLEKGILSKRLPLDLAKKCEDLLKERKGYMCGEPGPNWNLGPNWQDRTERFFNLAAEVAGATGGGK